MRHKAAEIGGFHEPFSKQVKLVMLPASYSNMQSSMMLVPLVTFVPSSRYIVTSGRGVVIDTIDKCPKMELNGDSGVGSPPLLVVSWLLLGTLKETGNGKPVRIPNMLWIPRMFPSFALSLALSSSATTALSVLKLPFGTLGTVQFLAAANRNEARATVAKNPT